MPKTFGNPGNYVLAEARRKFCRFLFVALFGLLILGYLCGLQHGLALSKNKYASLATLALLVPVAIAFFTRRHISRQADSLLDQAIAYRKGAEGEGLTADDLSNLPDTYSVFHDLTHPSIGGNIDHIVVGPTGVFALETKNWRGMVTLSGQGTLTVDGKHDKTKDGKAILGRALNLKKKIEALSNISTFVQAVMVFPKASVSVQPETRCVLTVLRLDLLEEHLKRPSSRPLTPAQVDTITRDLQALFKPSSEGTPERDHTRGLPNLRACERS
jgi:hypothetical protein